MPAVPCFHPIAQDHPDQPWHLAALGVTRPDKMGVPLVGSSCCILKWALWAQSSLIKAALSDASPDVLGHKSCVLPTNHFACMRWTHFIAKVAPFFAVTWRRLNGHEIFLGWALESSKPSALQEKTGQVASEEIQPGGLSQMVKLCNCRAEQQPRGWVGLQTWFIQPYSTLEVFMSSSLSWSNHSIFLNPAYTEHLYHLPVPVYISILDPNYNDREIHHLGL